MIHAKLCRLIRSPALILLLPVGLTVLLSILLLSPLEIGNGFDGYYYALQTRSVRETGTLLIPDQPLVFYLAAALSFLTGNPVTGVAALKIIIQA
ncbi:MAG TPA: hypothetical protein ENN69_02235, partial [Spirochaetia bacterium]|nr:hypothetical protein [Spirochaetia bacterium]